MAKFTLTIETEDAYELANLTAALAEEAGEVLEPAKNLSEEAARVMSTPKKTRAKKGSAPDVEQTGGVASDVTQPTQASPSTTASPFDLNVKQAEKDVAGIQTSSGATLQDCKVSLNALIEATDTDKALNVLKAFGIERVSACPEDKFGALKMALDEAVKAAR